MRKKNRPPHHTQVIGFNLIMAMLIVAILVSIMPQRDYEHEQEMKSERCF